MTSKLQNQIIVKIQSYLYSEVYKTECAALSITVQNVDRNIKSKSYNELRFILSQSAQQIVNQYC